MFLNLLYMGCNSRLNTARVLDIIKPAVTHIAVPAHELLPALQTNDTPQALQFYPGMATLLIIPLLFIYQAH